MNEISLQFTAADWMALFLQFAWLSLLGVGGAITSLADMHRFLVDQQHWITDAQFNSSVALAQAAPGPNILFVALMGWNVGHNTGSAWAALFGALVPLVGIMLPSSTLAYFSAQWSHRNRDRRGVRAFKQGLAPIVVALLVATGWVLATASGRSLDHWPVWLLTGVATLLVWRTRLHLLWLLGAGGVLGALGWV
jgi:chromate transporter